MTSRALSVLVHADTKVGKSTLGSTTPTPRLILDAEAAYRFLPGVKVFWDPMTEPPPTLGQGRTSPLDKTVYAVEWDTCVVIVRDYSIMTRAFDWLNQGQHPFRSVTIDSISEVQTRCKDGMRGVGDQMDMQKWGMLLDHMEWLIRGFRDLTEHPYHPLEAVVLTAMTANRDGKWRPYVQGQLATKMPYFLDVIGYMYVETVANQDDPTQPSQEVRKMLVHPHPMFEAGERVQGRLGAIVENPTITGMITQVFGPEQEQAA